MPRSKPPAKIIFLADEDTPAQRIIRDFKKLTVEEQQEVSRALWGDVLEVFGIN